MADDSEQKKGKGEDEPTVAKGKVSWKPDSPIQRKLTLEHPLLPDDVEKEGYLGPSIKSKDGNAEAGLLYYKGDVKSSIGYDLDKREAELNLIEAKAELSVAHASIKGKHEFWGDDTEEDDSAADSSSSSGKGPMAARLGDQTTHGDPLAPGMGSPDVFIGGKAAWRTTMDSHKCSIVKGGVADGAGVVLIGSMTVLINGQMACRVGDKVVEATGGPNPITMGCTTVFIGSSASSGSGSGGKTNKHHEGVTVSGNLKEEAGYLEGELALGAVVKSDAVKAQAKIGGMAAVFRATADGAIKIPLWGDHSVTLGVAGEATALAIGAQVHYDAGWDAKDGFKVSAGAKAGLAEGVGLAFTLGFK